LAVKTTLRGEMMHQFYYKWYFISAQQDNAVNKHFGIDDQSNS
jgi:hypothetical protein